MIDMASFINGVIKGDPQTTKTQITPADPYYDKVMLHFGYDPKDMEARRKMADYMRRSNIDAVGMMGKYNTLMGKEGVRKIIDNYQSFTPDTLTGNV
jgi:hypothetical protein